MSQPEFRVDVKHYDEYQEAIWVILIYQCLRDVPVIKTLIDIWWISGIRTGLLFVLSSTQITTFWIIVYGID